MKTYRIIMITELIVDANTEDEAFDNIDKAYKVDSYYDSIEKLSKKECEIYHKQKT